MLQKSYFNFITEDYMMYIFGGLRNCDNINAPTQYLSLQALKSSGFRNFDYVYEDLTSVTQNHTK